jgi:acetyl-CoA carboxylase carboxyl transferase subunit beta
MPPEGASVVMYQDAGRAAEIAEKQGVRSRDLLQAGIVDRVVPEFPDAADEPDAFCDRLGRVLARELARLIQADPGERHAARLARYARLGR